MKALRAGLAFAIAFGAALLLATGIANAVPFTRSTTIAYADRYSCNGHECRNSAYRSFGGSDCTNFVSQALHAGGMAYHSPDWYYANTSNYSRSWTLVNDHYYYLNTTKGYLQVGVLTGNALAGKYSPALAGDELMYDWGRGSYYSHLALNVGSGVFPGYYDSTAGKNYSQVTGGSGDWIDQHATDRYHAPWAWGYQTESNATIRSRMRVASLHFK